MTVSVGRAIMKYKLFFSSRLFSKLFKNPIFSHFFKISGSLSGKLAFIESCLRSCKVSLDIIFLLALYLIVFVFLNISNLNFSDLINLLKLTLISLLYKFSLIPKIFVSNNKFCPLKVGL